jgi:hypothetical protein
MRGRNNNGNNRRGPNPLTRSYESNGPDVKVRGTAAHVAEKYVQLARDAHSSGDGVLAESYLQHAEHYYRLIAAAHAQQQAHFNPPQPGQGAAADVENVDDEDEFEVSGADRFTYRSPQSFSQPQGGQPNGGGYAGQPYAQSGLYPSDQPQPEAAFVEGQPQPPMPRQERVSGERVSGERVSGERVHGERGHGERQPGERAPREGYGDRGPGGERQGERFGRRDRFRDRGPRPFPAQAAQPVPGMDDQPEPGLPAFITAGRPVVDEAPEAEGDAEGRFRNRRRRGRGRREEGEGGVAGASEPLPGTAPADTE